MWGAGDVIAYNSMSNILKTEAAQTKLLPAQTSTNEAQTIEPVLDEFGACGGAGDIIAYNSMSNILKTEAAQMKILMAQTSTNEAQTIETVLGEFGVCGGLSDLRKRLLNIILIS